MSAQLYIGSRYLPASDDLLLKTMLAWGSKQSTWYYSSDTAHCAAVIINLDSKQGRAEWNLLQESPKPPILIAYTQHLQRYHADYVLPRPMQADKLRNLLESLYQRSGQYSANNSSRAMADRDARSGVKILFDNVNFPTHTPNNAVNFSTQKSSADRARLIDVLLQHYKQPILVENNAVRVVLDCAHHTCYGALGYADLLILLQQPCTDYSIQVLTPDQKQQHIENLTSSDLSSPVWTVIMSGAFNNLSAEPVCPSDTPLMLEAWPDFQSLPHLPAHIAAATYLSRSSKTPRQLATATHTSLNILQPFINACLALGYITQAAEPKLFWHNEPPAIINSTAESLFSQLCQYLVPVSKFAAKPVTGNPI
ncbi:MAG: hypothetical protein R3F53_12795 [Gammaproteobacteria bacterium]